MASLKMRHSEVPERQVVIRQSSYSILVAVIVSFGGFIFGLDAALISGTLRSLIQQFSLSDLEVGAVVSAPGFGVIFALLATGYVCDQFGRKNALLIIAILYLGSCIAATFAPSFQALVAARFIGGLAFSSLSVAAMYIGEVAPPHARGKLVAVNQLNIVVGLLAAYFLNYLLVKLAALDVPIVQALGIRVHLWRWMLGMQIVPSLIWFLLLFLVPESPRWLLLRGKTDQAKTVIRQTLSEADQTDFWREFHETSSVDDRSVSLGEQLRAFFDKRLRLALFVGFTVAILQPITGINAILFYAPNVFEQVGIGSDQAFLQSAVMGLISVVFTALALVLIDRVGRRTLLLVGLTCAVISLGMCTWSFSEAKYVLTDRSVAALSQKFDATHLENMVGQTFTSDVDFKRAVSDKLGNQVAREHESDILQVATHLNAVVVLIGIMGFVAAFNFSIGPVLWVLLSEIFPSQVRGVAIPLTALSTSVTSYLVQQFFPWQLTNWGASSIFLFYAVCSAIGLGILMYTLPETKNKTIEEITLAFQRKGYRTK